MSITLNYSEPDHLDLQNFSKIMTNDIPGCLEKFLRDTIQSRRLVIVQLMLYHILHLLKCKIFHYVSFALMRKLPKPRQDI